MNQALGAGNYLHYNSYIPANLGKADLNTLLQNQKNLFKQRFNQINNFNGKSSLSFTEISNLLKD